MHAGLKTVSYVALAGTVVPSLLHLAGTLNHNAVQWAALAGTVVWFIVTPLWMGSELGPDADHVEI